MTAQPLNGIEEPDRPMRILVTGGAGFIGSALVRHLIAETGHEVLTFDKLTYAGNLYLAGAGRRAIRAIASSRATSATRRGRGRGLRRASAPMW